MHHIPKILTLLVIILNTSEIVIGADTNETIEWTRNPEVELPPCLIICKRNVAAQERNECIKNSIKGYLPSVKEGYAPLGIEPIEPYILPKNRLEFRQGELYAKMIMKDTAIAGINYKGRGGYNEFKVNSAGHAKMTLTNATGTWKFLGKTETIQNEEYMIINSLDLANFVVQNMHFDISGLFPDPDVNEFALAFLNQVWQSVYQQILPQLKSVWEPATLDMVNKIFARVPYRRLLLKE
uniref:CSON013970 protein n=1 Tax=Culicoides sonorensis TaxID=179676 RepID=A0A336KP11_CULSO